MLNGDNKQSNKIWSSPLNQNVFVIRVLPQIEWEMREWNGTISIITDWVCSWCAHYRFAVNIRISLIHLFSSANERVHNTRWRHGNKKGFVLVSILGNLKWMPSHGAHFSLIFSIDPEIEWRYHNTPEFRIVCCDKYSWKCRKCL